jgi:N-acetyl-anhydromuramoyl-L-alanine amidase
MTYHESILPSPNHDASARHEQCGVCFHHTVLDLEQTIARLRDPRRRAAYHVIIGEQGQRVRLVEDHLVAWHAGVSRWRGRENCNHFLLGVAFVGDTYRVPLSEAQMESALAWMTPRWHRHGWSLAMMTDHRQVAPDRKDDLNPAEWARWWKRLRTLQA